jgi:hypothetical protein
MDGRVTVTPTRWLQQQPQQSQQRNSKTSQPTSDKSSETSQPTMPPSSRVVKPKTPSQSQKTQKTPSRTTDLLEEFGAEFGMTKELITPIEQNIHTDSRGFTSSSRNSTLRSQETSRPVAPAAQEPVKSPVEYATKPKSVREDSSPGIRTVSNANTANTINTINNTNTTSQTIYAPDLQTQYSQQQYSQQQYSQQQYSQQQYSQQSATSFTDEEINEMLANGYLSIVREMWEYIPAGSHVRFFKKGNGSPNVRFRPGGYIKKHYLTADGKRILLMETVRGGTNSTPGYITYPMALDDLDQIWKRYPEEFYVEMHLIYNSLVRKDKQINDLLSRLTALESRFKK